MKAWKKAKGNRIRASDKSLVYHFCIGWLLDRGQMEATDTCNTNEITYCLGGGNLKYAAGICVNEYSLLNQCKRILLSTDGIHEYVSTDELEDGEMNMELYLSFLQ